MFFRRNDCKRQAKRRNKGAWPSHAHAGRRCQDSASNTASSRCRRFSAQQPPWLPAGGFRQHMNEIAVGSKAVFLCGFNQAVNHCAALGPTFRICKQPVFPSHYKGFYTAFHTVIGDLQPPIFQKSDQVWPLFPQIIQCPTQRGLRRSSALHLSPYQ